MEAFVYCWTDHKTKKLYVGSHKGNSDDGYVCSSKYMMEEYENRPEDFSRQIIATGTWDDMFKFEGKILQTLNVKNDPRFYNQHNGSGNFRNKGLTEESRKKISAAKKGKPSPIKGYKFGTCWNKGKTDIYSEETLEKLRKASIGKKGFWKGKSIPKHVRQTLIEVNIGNNNASKKILTPHGTFNSTSEAARKLNMSYNEVRDLVRKNIDWRRI